MKGISIFDVAGLFIVALCLCLIVAVFPACGADKDIEARIIVEDITGKKVYVMERKPESLKDKVYLWPRRHPRIWKTGKVGGSVFLWTCQVLAAVRK